MWRGCHQREEVRRNRPSLPGAVRRLQSDGRGFAHRSGDKVMAKSKKRSPAGLLSEAAKKAGQAVGDAARKAVGKKKRAGGKSPAGNLSEAAKKVGRGVGDAAKKAVGKRPSRVKKSGTK